MSKNKMTAVEWLSDKLVEILGDKCNELTQEQTLANHYAIKQALQMEREQIEEAFFKGHNDGYNAGVSCYDQVEFQSGDIYYTQTYE